MARLKGIFKASANYEPQVAAPFDARMLVEAKSELTTAATWQQTNGSVWTYVGMIVSVSADIEPSNNGVYILINEDWTLESSWRRLANEQEIADLQEQIENIKVAGGGSLDLDIETEDALPETGDENTTYYVKENHSIWRWDAEAQTYASYGGTAAPDITLIYGGNANGTD